MPEKIYKSGILEGFLAFVLFLSPVIFFLLSADSLISQYYFRPTDLQEDYFYGGLRLWAGEPLYSPTHPGVPIYFLMSVVMSWFENPVGDAADIFATLYIVTTLLASAALVTALQSERSVSWGVRVLVLSTIFLWPPFLLYVATFGADSFVLPISLMLISFAWWRCGCSTPLSIKTWAIISVILGVLMTIKSTLIVVVAAVLIALYLHEWLRTRRHPWAWGFVVGAGLVLGVGAALWSVLWNIFSYATTIFAPPDFLQAKKGVIERIDIWLERIAEFSLVSASVFGILLAITCVAIAWGGVAAWRNSGCRGSMLPRIVMLVLMLVGLSRAMGVPFADEVLPLGTALRNSSAFVVAFPFGVFLCLGLAKETFGNIPLEKFGIVGAILLIGVGVMNQADLWQKFMTYKQERYRSEISLVEKFLNQQGPVATLGIKGEPEFHFFGNQKYAGNFFDEAVIQAFPNWSYVRDYTLAGWQRPLTPPETLPSNASLYQKLRNLRRQYLPIPPVMFRETILTSSGGDGEIQGAIIEMVRLERTLCDISCLIGRLDDQGVKIATWHQESLYDTRYLLIRFQH